MNPDAHSREILAEGPAGGVLAETTAGKGWFPYFRFYAPTEPYFEKSWSLPDIEKVK